MALRFTTAGESASGWWRCSRGLPAGLELEPEDLDRDLAHDEIFWSEDRGFHRETNHAGGLEGGMTTVDPLIVRGAMKPLPTLTKPRSVDLATKEPAQAVHERTDSCTVPAAGVGGRGGGGSGPGLRAP